MADQKGEQLVSGSDAYAEGPPDETEPSEKVTSNEQGKRVVYVLED